MKKLEFGKLERSCSCLSPLDKIASKVRNFLARFKVSKIGDIYILKAVDNHFVLK